MASSTEKTAPREIISGGVYTIAYGDGKTALELVEEVHKEWRGVSTDSLLSLRSFILSPKFRVQKEPGLVELELVDADTQGERLWESGQDATIKVLRERGYEMPTEEDALRFAILTAKKRVSHTILFPHVDNLFGICSSKEDSFIGLFSDNFSLDGKYLREISMDAHGGGKWYAVRRPGSSRPTPPARDWILL